MSDKTQGPKRTGAERWNDAVRIAYERDDDPAATDAEAIPGPEEILAMSDEQIERQLREAGIDLAALDAKADLACETYKERVAKVEPAPTSEEPAAWVASRQTVPSTSRVRATRGRVALVACAVAVAAGAVGVAAYLASRSPPQKDVTPRPDAGHAPTPEAPNTAEPKPAATTAPATTAADQKKGR